MAASTLRAGDVAIVGFNTAQSDSSGQPATTNAIQFVLMNPIGSGAVIYFTDRGWNGASFSAGGGDGTYTFTAGADLPAGTVITITSGQLAAAGIDLDELGDTVYVYQGGADAPTTFLTAVEFGDNGTFNGSLANTGLVVGETALAIDADSGGYAGPTTHQQNALVNPGQSLLQAIMDAGNWATDNRDTFNAKVQVVPDQFFVSPDFQILGATYGGSGDGVVSVSGDSTVSSGLFGFNQVRIYNSDGDESVTYQDLHFRPSDLVIDTVHGKYFLADSDLAGHNRILQGNLSDLLGNPGDTPTLTVLYSDATSGVNSQIRNLAIDPDNGQVFFSHAVTTAIQRVSYDTANQTPVTLVNLGSGNPNGNANNFVDDFVINFATGEIYITSHRVIAAADGDVVSRNYLYKATGLTSGSATTLTYSVMPFSPDDDDAGIITTPGEAFPREFGSLEGLAISPDGTMLYFATATVLEDHDGDGDPGDAVVRPGGIYSYALTGNAAGTFTQIFVQTIGGAGPQGLLDELEIDFTTGRYYVTDTTGGTAGAGDEGVWTGLLTGGMPTLFEVIANANGGNVDGFAINRAPTLSVTSSGATYTEAAGSNSPAGTGVAPISAATAADIDTAGLDDQLAGAVVRISDGFQSGASHQDVLTINGATSGTIAGSGIVYSYDSTLGIMILTGAATFAEYQAALALVRFAVSGDDPTNDGANGTRTISFSVSDGLITSDEQDVSVNVTGVNDAPVNTVGAAASGAEDAASIALTGISVSDADANPATQTITVTLSVATGTLDIRTDVSGGVTAGMVTGDGTGTITITATQDQINATLANGTGLLFSAPADFNGSLNLTVTSDDGGLNGNDPGLTGTGTSEQDVDTKTINVSAVNDAPVVVSGDSADYTEGGAPVAISPTLTISDIDSANLTGAIVEISDFVTGDRLIFINQNGITGLYDTTTGVLTLTGTASIATYEAALRSIGYTHIADADVGGTDTTRTVSFTVTDGVDPSTAATATVVITSMTGPTPGDDTLAGTPGDDIIDGEAGDDELSGGAGDDYLRGGTGADHMLGGTGDDFYVVDDAGDDPDETGGDGIDTVHSRISWTLGADLENLTLSAPAGAADGTGNSLNNTITGNASANVLSGLDGDDSLIGGGGADSLYGGAGTDSLDGGSHEDFLDGGDGDDDLLGGAGNDYLRGGDGADHMEGGLGNDFYAVDNVGDTIVEAVNAGTDHVWSRVSWTLGANFENLTLGAAAGAAQGHGNALRNVITGNASANLLTGGDEVDTLRGGGGDDLLSGDGGNDVLYGENSDDAMVGGDGSDKLTGGAGSDRFVFIDADIGLSSLGATIDKDQILDLTFSGSSRDIVDLSAIDANVNVGGNQAFVWATAFTGVAGQAIMKFAGGVTTLQLDVDGDGKADLRIEINGDVTGTTANLYNGTGDPNGGWVL